MIFIYMDAIEFLNIILPTHDKTSCHDDNLNNGFWSIYGYNDLGKWYGRCRRCMALQIIKNDDDVPKNADLSEIL